MKKITSDRELREIAFDWCCSTEIEATEEVITAFIMGAKLAINHKGWVKCEHDFLITKYDQFDNWVEAECMNCCLKKTNS